MKKTMIPKEAKPIPLRPLALGEKTGHHHSLAVEDQTMSVEDLVQLYEMPSVKGLPRHFLKVKGEGVVLTHQEHKTHDVPPGEYEVTIQTEVTDWGRAPVID